nr:MAG TPA: integrase [Caudoviricetes sp.]
MEKKVNYIPAARPLQHKKVGIYCRVSTNDMEQLNSLTNQISALTRLVSSVDEWKLVDCYIDIASAKGKSPRSNFERMLDDCKSKKLDIVITKSVRRFGRDTVDTLQALNVMKEFGVRVIFEQESLDTKDVESSLMISIIESLAQAENESRSDNIEWGMRQRAAQGTSKLYDRKCYGYEYDENGKLIVNEEQAVVVRKIFNWYLGGLSVNGIIKELEKQTIKSSTGKDKWNKRALEVMLSNEKYKGAVRLFDDKKSDVQYLATDNHPAIITEEVFEAVQKEKANRSNIVVDENGQSVRRYTKYSSKNKNI